MGIMDEVNGALFGSSVKGLSFEPGDKVEGTLVAVDSIHERQYNDDGSLGALLYWGADNKVTQATTDRPKKLPVLTLQTDLRENDDDDGLRKLFLKGRSKKNPGSIVDALRVAVREAGEKELELGAYIGMACTQRRGEGNQAPKDYVGKYKSAANNDHPTKNMVAILASASAGTGSAPVKKDPFS